MSFPVCEVRESNGLEKLGGRIQTSQSGPEGKSEDDDFEGSYVELQFNPFQIRTIVLVL